MPVRRSNQPTQPSARLSAALLVLVGLLPLASCGESGPPAPSDSTTFAAVAEYLRAERNMHALYIDAYPYVSPGPSHSADSAIVAAIGDSVAAARSAILLSRGIAANTTDARSACAGSVPMPDASCFTAEPPHFALSTPFRWEPYGRFNLRAAKVYKGVYAVVAHAVNTTWFDGAPGDSFHINFLLREVGGQWRVTEARCC